MTAHRLRTAAAKLREVAGGAAAGPWWVSQEGLTHPVGANVKAEDASVVEDCCGYQGGATVADATYIATMSPPVALAMATWLEAHADTMDLLDEMAQMGERVPSVPDAEALAVADAVLGDGGVVSGVESFCRVHWGSHGCELTRGHDGPHECDCCECPDHARDHEGEGCVAKPPYYGSSTWFYGEDAS